jgi:protease-4
MYGRFLNIVAESRHKTPQQVDQIAQGRVWDGGTAHQLGLVDGFGGVSEAVAKAAQLAGLGNERGVRYLEPPVSFRQQLIEALSDEQADAPAVPQDAFASLARAPQQQLASMLGEVRSILGGASIQARCIECPDPTPRRLDKQDLSLLALLKEWLA